MLNAFIPIWLLTVLGYLVARFNLVGTASGAAAPAPRPASASASAEAAAAAQKTTGTTSADVEAVLGRFVFRVAMPASLFGMLAKSSLHALANTSIIAFGVSSLGACALGFVLTTRVFGRDTPEGALGGMASGYVNSANLGIPVAVQVLGNAVFLSTVILFNTMLVTPIVLTLMGLRNAEAPGIRHRLRTTALLPVRNPIIIASALGALVSATHVHVPKDVGNALSLLGGAAVPIALITLGMSLHAGTKAEKTKQPSKPSKLGKTALIAETATAIFLKTAFHPALAYLLARYALGLPAHDVLAVTLCAALPTAQNVFIYASEYDLDTAFARNAVICSTVVSMAGLWTVVALVK